MEGQGFPSSQRSIEKKRGEGREIGRGSIRGEEKGEWMCPPSGIEREKEKANPRGTSLLTKVSCRLCLAGKSSGKIQFGIRGGARSKCRSRGGVRTETVGLVRDLAGFPSGGRGNDYQVAVHRTLD